MSDCEFCGQPMSEHRPVGEYRVCPGGIGPGERYESGVEAERAAIVAWLRTKAARMETAIERSPENRLVPAAEDLAAIYRRNADAIERGDHLSCGAEKS